MKIGVLRSPTPPTVRALLVPSNEKNRTLGTLAKKNSNTPIAQEHKDTTCNSYLSSVVVSVLSHEMLKDWKNHVTLP
jgi:hypothetical protein